MEMSNAWTMPLLFADVVWPSLFLEQHLLSVLPISVGLVAEWLILYFGGFGLSWKKAVVVDLVMNTVSSIAGIFLIPVLGLAWEFGPGRLINRTFNVGTFNVASWTATLLFSTGASTAIESAVVRWGFKIPLGWRRFWMLCAANAISTGIAMASLWIHPPKY
jgi:hypothetical protein